MARFVDRLREASRQANSLVCVGLDVEPVALPRSISEQPDAIFAFNKAIIDATADLVCAYKPNLAFYEALGPAGWDVLARTVAYIPSNIVTIADAKRGDIGHTAKAYAKAIFEVYGFDAVTVNPYLGQDSVQPFLDYSDRGVFVLCKTSNPGSSEFQDLQVRDRDGDVELRPLYEVVARRVREWNSQGNCGLVVGATYVKELAAIRRAAPELPILIPGVGAQAGDLEAAVQDGVDERGELAIINSSRGVIYASRGDDFSQAARQSASTLRDAINRARFARTAGGAS
ncbi:MAG: orotidine-5'-phosphate decarboxylase [Chloroflexota bacterium]